MEEQERQSRVQQELKYTVQTDLVRKTSGQLANDLMDMEKERRSKSDSVKNEYKNAPSCAVLIRAKARPHNFSKEKFLVLYKVFIISCWRAPCVINLAATLKVFGVVEASWKE